LCDQVAIINRGKIVVQGSMDDLRRRSDGGSSTLEEIFVNTVGGDRYTDKLDWL
jgi:ABC-type Na+ transport system ATPase subunit NatA